ncbi:MAG: hypothetical protein JXB04_08390 [Kiritimatiellae bacterium]|nr:hypothetical protein [Kiritimatiellia bacterium]
MVRRRGPIATSALFVVFAAMFWVIFWPDVSTAAKLAFFATGIGCGIGIGRLASRAR